jgi:vacuolar-type H+-ATPase subunit E/Vma4
VAKIMSQNVNEFLEAIKSKTTSELNEIQKTADPNIDAINEKIKRKISNLEAVEDSTVLTQEVINSFQRRISNKQIEWLKRTNNEKGRLIDQLLMKLENQFKSLVQGSEFYDLLTKLFLEINQEAGSTYEVHITKNSDPEKFKSTSGINQNVVADLDTVGILLKRLDYPISIENTLESRFTKNRDDLIIEATQGLWNDLEDSPWQFKTILSHLMSKESLKI